jgi:hypothetical protein
MLKFLVALNIAIWSLVSVEIAHANEPQKVCIDKIGKDGKVVTGKDGKPQQECKMMKVHKKLEVEEVKKK